MTNHVIVVGAGRAGSMATRKCAQLALKTLLLEKMTLPRDKLCLGMVTGQMAQDLIEDERVMGPRYILAAFAEGLRMTLSIT